MNKILFESVYKESLEKSNFGYFTLSSYISVNVTKTEHNEVLCEVIFYDGDIHKESKTTIHKDLNIEEAIKSEIDEVARRAAKIILNNSNDHELLDKLSDDLISDLDYEKLLEVVTFTEGYLN